MKSGILVFDMGHSESPSGGSGSQAASTLEHSSVRETLRELLFQIPGFKALAERVGLVSPPPHLNTTVRYSKG